jgi:aryl-alcohol dehydrogenase-like predicted oxidoreductase
VLAALDQVANEAGHTLAQVALAWIAAKITAPIASATSVAQVEELLGAMELQLNAKQIATLGRLGLEPTAHRRRRGLRRQCSFRLNRASARVPTRLG